MVEERPEDDFNANLAEGMDERTLKDMGMIYSRIQKR